MHLSESICFLLTFPFPTYHHGDICSTTITWLVFFSAKYWKWIRSMAKQHQSFQVQDAWKTALSNFLPLSASTKLDERYYPHQALSIFFQHWSFLVVQVSVTHVWLWLFLYHLTCFAEENLIMDAFTMQILMVSLRSYLIVSYLFVSHPHYSIKSNANTSERIKLVLFFSFQFDLPRHVI